MSILSRNALATAAAALLTVSIAACQRDTGQPDGAATVPDAAEAPIADAGAPMTEAELDPAMGEPQLIGGCDAEAAQAHVGQEATDATVEQARIDSGAESVRVLAPGDAATMDFRPERLNIDIDDNNIIQTLRCG